jgi:cytochrome c biogenesis protein CcmG/thiol:disulfide interchange protein DsbE
MPVAARRLGALIPLGIFIALVVALAVGMRLDLTTIPSALIGKPVPEFALPPLLEGGQGLNAADLRRGGGPVLVNVFASWCVPCREEQPMLMDLARQDGVTLYGINYKDKPAAARQFLAELGNPFTRIGADRSGRVAIDWGVYGVPETYVVDGTGKIVLKHVGPLTPKAVTDEILPALRGARP